jgi:hypothetical protein
MTVPNDMNHPYPTQCPPVLIALRARLSRVKTRPIGDVSSKNGRRIGRTGSCIVTQNPAGDEQRSAKPSSRFPRAPDGNQGRVAKAKSNILVLLVTRRTSGVGRRMESVLARLQVRERDRVRVARVDADDRPDLVRRLGVQEIPSIVMFRDRRKLACLKGRATLGDVQRTLSEHVADEESRAAHV